MSPVAPPVRYTTTTESLAVQCAVKPASVRVKLCRDGSYYGLRPIKLPNGRLLWPDDAQERLAALAAKGGAV